MVAPRAAQPTLRFVDEYCQLYVHLFPEVRSFEAFKYLHLGMISDLKRKTLPAIARIVGLDNEQGLHHLIMSNGSTSVMSGRRKTASWQSLPTHCSRV
jgi:SRSO17 transposase